MILSKKNAWIAQSIIPTASGTRNQPQYVYIQDVVNISERKFYISDGLHFITSTISQNSFQSFFHKFSPNSIQFKGSILVLKNFNFFINQKVQIEILVNDFIYFGEGTLLGETRFINDVIDRRVYAGECPSLNFRIDIKPIVPDSMYRYLMDNFYEDYDTPDPSFDFEVFKNGIERKTSDLKRSVIASNVSSTLNTSSKHVKECSINQPAENNLAIKNSGIACVKSNGAENTLEHHKLNAVSSNTFTTNSNFTEHRSGTIKSTNTFTTNTKFAEQKVNLVKSTNILTNNHSPEHKPNITQSKKTEIDIDEALFNLNIKLTNTNPTRASEGRSPENSSISFSDGSFNFTADSDLMNREWLFSSLERINSEHKNKVLTDNPKIFNSAKPALQENTNIPRVFSCPTVFIKNDVSSPGKSTSQENTNIPRVFSCPTVVIKSGVKREVGASRCISRSVRIPVLNKTDNSELSSREVNSREVDTREVDTREVNTPENNNKTNSREVKVLIPKKPDEKPDELKKSVKVKIPKKSEELNSKEIQFNKITVDLREINKKGENIYNFENKSICDKQNMEDLTNSGIKHNKREVIVFNKNEGELIGKSEKVDINEEKVDVDKSTCKKQDIIKSELTCEKQDINDEKIDINKDGICEKQDIIKSELACKEEFDKCEMTCNNEFNVNISKFNPNTTQCLLSNINKDEKNVNSQQGCDPPAISNNFCSFSSIFEQKNENFIFSSVEQNETHSLELINQLSLSRILDSCSKQVDSELKNNRHSSPDVLGREHSMSIPTDALFDESTSYCSTDDIKENGEINNIGEIGNTGEIGETSGVGNIFVGKNDDIDKTTQVSNNEITQINNTEITSNNDNDSENISTDSDDDSNYLKQPNRPKGIPLQCVKIPAQNRFKKPVIYIKNTCSMENKDSETFSDSISLESNTEDKFYVYKNCYFYKKKYFELKKPSVVIKPRRISSVKSLEEVSTINKVKRSIVRNLDGVDSNINEVNRTSRRSLDESNSNIKQDISVVMKPEKLAENNLEQNEYETVIKKLVENNLEKDEYETFINKPEKLVENSLEQNECKDIIGKSETSTVENLKEDECKTVIKNESSAADPLPYNTLYCPRKHKWSALLPFVDFLVEKTNFKLEFNKIKRFKIQDLKLNCVNNKRRGRSKCFISNYVDSNLSEIFLKQSDSGVSFAKKLNDPNSRFLVADNFNDGASFIKRIKSHNRGHALVKKICKPLNYSVQLDNDKLYVKYLDFIDNYDCSFDYCKNDTAKYINFVDY